MKPGELNPDSHFNTFIFWRCVKLIVQSFEDFESISTSSSHEKYDVLMIGSILHGRAGAKFEVIEAYDLYFISL